LGTDDEGIPKCHYTSIRHALIDDEGTYTPTADEAIFMLVSCSAFVNYLRKK